MTKPSTTYETPGKYLIYTSTNIYETQLTLKTGNRSHVFPRWYRPDVNDLEQSDPAFTINQM